jgi:CRISPR-associated protein Cmr6
MPEAPRRLYRGVDTTLSMPNLVSGMHAGLWYDKFYRAPAVEPRAAKKVGHGVWIGTVTSSPVGDRARLAETIGRRRRMVTCLGGRLDYARATSRFVTGLGRAHPVENGFAWHHTLGTPYLPGSSIKGMVRAWASMMGVEPSLIDELLGRPARGELPACVGVVDFLDGLPIEPVRLEADVMTPHYGPYHQRGELPGDWHSPVPVPFLVAAAGLTLQFGVVARARVATVEERQAVDTAATWLLDALRELGAGAKTAVGYGRFEPVEGSALGAAWVGDLAERMQASASPLDRARDEVAGLNEQQALELVSRLSGGSASGTDVERDALRAALAERFLKSWESGRMGNLGKAKRRAYLAWLKGEA